MRTWGYRLATLVLLAAFAFTCALAYFGWLLPGSATTTAQRNAVHSRASARVGTHITGGGSHFGK
ncbi:hypothetical protein [Armatimonas rosea]|uniref:Uncharacterized protein n=1 Tax=Armatimonas rosea TaxID=685828 RepID=A0A7W9SUN6_ARMRO|nr:hypothetical protein [Armatimonas rosea]MBB6052688.1 hypothetical protein [Armatimonas rosea]